MGNRFPLCVNPRFPLRAQRACAGCQQSIAAPGSVHSTARQTLWRLPRTSSQPQDQRGTESSLCRQGLRESGRAGGGRLTQEDGEHWVSFEEARTRTERVFALGIATGGTRWTTGGPGGGGGSESGMEGSTGATRAGGGTPR